MEIRDDEHYGVESDIPKFVMVPNWVLEIRVNGQPLLSTLGDLYTGYSRPAKTILQPRPLFVAAYIFSILPPCLKASVVGARCKAGSQ